MFEQFGITGVTKELIKLLISLGGTIIVAYIIRFTWKNLFLRIAHKTPTKLDIMIIEGTAVPIYFVILATGFYIFFQKFASLSEIQTNIFINGIRGILYTFFILSLFYFLYAFVKSFCDWYLQEIAIKTETKFDEQFIPLFTKLIKIVIFFIAATIILSHFKVNISGFIATAGVASLAVAFAAQETLANIIAGFMIMIDKPFRIGDRIELSSGEIGDVYEIGLRTTKILSFDNTLIVIPNSEIARTRVINHSYPDPKVKIRQTIGVAYGSDLDKVKRVILDVCQSHPEVLKDPAPVVFFSNFGESSLDLIMVCWIKDFKEKIRITDELNMAIKKRFEEEGIEIPFPQRVVHIKTEKG